jgi:hypothetical protein|uniref:Minor capsid protein P9 transmembrane helices domain-containing protein n=1 Tax=viral metagenome TaxID=1070528 RepID=A0A6C0AKP5_9ZZZZ
MMSDKFWLDDITILFDPRHIKEIWPYGDYPLARRLNALSRLVLLLSVISYLVFESGKIIMSCVVTLVVICILYKNEQIIGMKNLKKQIHLEGFNNPDYYKSVKDNYTSPTKKNPLMNVMLTDIKDNPKRKPAAPAFNSIVEKEINDAALNRKLFADLGDNLSFEGSMRNFYSMPNTSIPNNQEDFAKFCYGDTGYCRNKYKTVPE